MVGRAGPQASYVHPVGFQFVRQFVNFRRRPADNLVGAVVHADAQVGVRAGFPPFRHRRRYPVCRGENGGHSSGLGQRAHQPPPGRGKLHSLLQGEHPGGLGCGNLPQAMAQHGNGLDSHAFPQGGEGTFQGVDSRLSPAGFVQFPVGAGPAKHHVQQGKSPLLPDKVVAKVQDGPENGFAFVQPLSHAHPLVALAGINKGDFGGGLAGAGCAGWVGIRYGLQVLAQGVGIAKDHTFPEVKMAAGCAGRPG